MVSRASAALEYRSQGIRIPVVPRLDEDGGDALGAIEQAVDHDAHLSGSPAQSSFLVEIAEAGGKVIDEGSYRRQPGSARRKCIGRA
jgi:hypothetical protein